MSNGKEIALNAMNDLVQVKVGLDIISKLEDLKRQHKEYRDKNIHVPGVEKEYKIKLDTIDECISIITDVVTEPAFKN